MMLRQAFIKNLKPTVPPCPWPCRGGLARDLKRTIPDCKGPYYGNHRKRIAGANNETVSNKKAKVHKHPKQACLPGACANTGARQDEVEESDNAVNDSHLTAEGGHKAVGAKINWLLAGTCLFDDNGKSFSSGVKETLRIFNMHYLHFVHVDPFSYSLLKITLFCCISCFTKNTRHNLYYCS